MTDKLEMPIEAFAIAVSKENARLRSDNERLRAALEGLLRCPAIADGNHNEPAWACPETIEAERRARAALGGDA